MSYELELRKMLEINILCNLSFIIIIIIII